MCERFSKRRGQIDAALEKLLADQPELKGGNIAELRSRLATNKANSKTKDIKPR